MDGKGHVVTNEHVVEGGNEFSVRFGEDGDLLPAKLVGKDASSDLAVLEVDPDKVPAETDPLQLASSSQLRPGDVAIAIGSPFGLSGSVTTGIISALDREITSPNGFQIPGVLQTDAAINPGNSGGPLLDAEGRVIGVNSQIASSSRQSSGVGFAVPVDTVKQVVPQLIKGGDIERAFLGVTTSPGPDGNGAVVAAISQTGPPPPRSCGTATRSRPLRVARSRIRRTSRAPCSSTSRAITSSCRWCATASSVRSRCNSAPVPIRSHRDERRDRTASDPGVRQQREHRGRTP